MIITLGIFTASPVLAQSLSKARSLSDSWIAPICQPDLELLDRIAAHAHRLMINGYSAAFRERLFNLRHDRP